jgi:hypothetical protein
MPAADYSAYFNRGTTPQNAVLNWNMYGNPTDATNEQITEAFQTIANFPGGSAVAAANLIFGEGVPSASTRYQNPIEIANAIKSNPIQFTIDNASDIGTQLYFSPDVFKNYTKEAGSLGFNNTQLTQINSSLQEGLKQGGVNQERIKEFEATFGQDKLLKFVESAALSFFLPGVGSAIAESLIAEGIVTSQVAANVIGSVIANTTASVAQGNSFDDALKNSLVSAAVSTGSVDVAKEVNKFVTSKAVTDAIVSAGASAVKTAATGGTEQDVINNMTGALAGSAASSAYQLGGEDYTRQTGRVIGSAVAGYVTSGPTGAVSNLVGELGSQSKGKVAGTIEDTFKGTTDTPALPASQVEALNPPTDAGAASGADALNQVDVTGKALAPDITSTNIIDTIARTTPGTPPPPTVSAPPKLETVEVSGKALPKATDITDTDILDTIANEKKPDAQLKRVEISGKKEEPLALETKTITGKADGTLPPVNISGKADEPAPVAEEPVPEEKPYKPDLFILSGKQPKTPTTAPKTSTSALSQALGTTTGLTASRGAGEIEDPSTGKKKRKVWNEETLRLKDALGV